MADTARAISDKRSNTASKLVETHSVETMIVPDVDTGAFGRAVGCSVVSVPEGVAESSGTETREAYEKNEPLAGQHFED